jgi:hypothetical protein
MIFIYQGIISLRWEDLLWKRKEDPPLGGTNL